MRFKKCDYQKIVTKRIRNLLEKTLIREKFYATLGQLSIMVKFLYLKCPTNMQSYINLCYINPTNMQSYTNQPSLSSGAFEFLGDM